MKKTALSVILVILAEIVIYFIFKDKGLNYDKKALKTKIDSLDNQLKLKEDTINVKEAEIQVIESKVEHAQEVINANNSKINKIRSNYEIQVRTVDSYDVIQLEKFFTDRYSDTTSIK